MMEAALSLSNEHEKLIVTTFVHSQVLEITTHVHPRDNEYYNPNFQLFLENLAENPEMLESYETETGTIIWTIRF